MWLPVVFQNHSISYVRRTAASILVIALTLSSPLAVMAQAADVPVTTDIVTTSPAVTPAPTPDPEFTPPTEPAPVFSLDPNAVVTPTDPAAADAMEPATTDVAPADSTLAADAIVDPPQQSLMAGQSASSPTITNASVFSYQTLQPRLDKTTGALTFSVPLEVPKGRNGLQPSLALSYNSSALDDHGIVGYGWSLSIPYIERMNKRGLDNIYTDNYFSSSLSGELATSTATSTGYYSARVDDGSFMRYSYANGWWIAYDKQGTKYTFGSTTSSQLVDPGNATHVYRWMLAEIRDTNNNYITYTYSKDGNQLYPSTITYTGNGVTNGAFSIAFTLASSSISMTSYRSGFSVTTGKRITTIAASQAGTMLRSYALSYTTGNNGYRSLLWKVEQSGRDALGTTITMPPVIFTYENTTVSTVGIDGETAHQAYAVADANGDSLNDKSLFMLNQTSGLITGDVNGSGISAPPEYWAISHVDGPTSEETGTRFVDVNGDGYADIARNDGTTNKFYLNTSSSTPGTYVFSSVATSTLPGVIPVFKYVAPNLTFASTGLFGNLNGDGAIDYSYSLLGTKNAYLGNGGAWNATSSIYVAKYDMPGTGGGPPITSSQLLDINGDGLDDWAYSNNTNTFVCMNTGLGWESTCDSAWTLATSTLYNPVGSEYYDRGMRFLDINGDGLSDFVRSYSNTATAGSTNAEVGTSTFAYLNTGHGWATTTVAFSYFITSFAGAGVQTNRETFDDDGDGVPTNTTKHDILTRIAYPQQGTTQISYANPATLGGNANLGLPRMVVTSLVNDDQNGTVDTRTYSYTGGKLYMDRGLFDRTFAGFSSITETRADGTRKTYFNQADGVDTASGEQSDDFAFIGKPYREDVVATSSTLLKRTFSKWLSTASSASSSSPLATISYGTSTFDGGSTGTLHTFNFTVTCATNDAAIMIFPSSIPDIVTNVTWNGVTTTNVSATSYPGSGRVGVRGYYLWPAATGTHQVAVTSSNNTVWTSAISYCGVASSSAPEVQTSVSMSLSNSMTGTLTTLSPNSWTVFAEGDSSGSEIAGTSTTQRIQASTPGFFLGDSNGPIATATSTSLGVRWSAAITSAAGFIYALKPNGGTPTTTPASNTQFAQLAKQMVQFFDQNGSGSHKDRATEYDYSTSTGDLLTLTDRGEVTGASDGTYSDTGSDMRTTTRAYIRNESTNLSANTNETLNNNAGTKVRETRRYYDGATTTTSVTKGNMTKEENWITGSTYASTTRTYNTLGLVASSTDPRGNRMLFAYDSTLNRDVSSTTNALGHNTQATYDLATGQATQITDPNGLVRQFVFDGIGRLTQEKQPDLNAPASLVTKRSVAYTDNTLPSSTHVTTNFASATSSHSYEYFDGFGRSIQTRSQASPSNTFAVRTKRYNSAGLVDKASLPYFASSSAWAAATTTASLFSNFNFDAVERPLTVANAVGTTTYNYNGWNTTEADPNGNQKTLGRDAFDNLTQVVERNGTTQGTTTYAYDALNNLTSVTDAASNIRAFTYDGLSRRSTAEDLHQSGDGTFGTYSYTYDFANNLSSRVDPKSQTVNYTYDTLNRPLTEDFTSATGTEVTYSYDTCQYGKGLLCSASTTATVATTTYNALGLPQRISKKINNAFYISSTTYDYQGNSVILTAPNLAETKYDYDSAGFVSRISFKKSGGSYTDVVRGLEYAPTGAVSKLRYANGLESSRMYDPAKAYRLINMATYSPSSTSTSQVTTDFYPAGNGDGSIRYWNQGTFAAAHAAQTGYNNGVGGVVDTGSIFEGNLNFVCDTSPCWGAWLISRTFLPFDTRTIPADASIDSATLNIRGYKYVAGGMLSLVPSTQASTTQLVDTDYGKVDFNTLLAADKDANDFGLNPGTIQSWALNSTGLNAIGKATSTRMAVLTWNDRSSTTPGYVPGGTNNNLGLANIYSSRNATDKPYLHVTYTVGGGNYVHNESYTYDATGNITRIVNNSSGADKRDVTYSYDGLNRLVTASTTSATSTPFSETYAYDLLGSLTAKKNGATSTYSYSSTGYTNPHAPTQIANGLATTSYSYDNNGNLTSAGTSTYSYDYENRMTQSVTNGTSSNYAYDHTGARITLASQSATTTYVDKSYSLLGKTTGATTTATTTNYIFLGDMLVALFEQPTINGSATGTATTTYVHTDHLNSTVLMTNASGTAVQTLDYYPYGGQRISQSTNGADAKRRFIGEVTDGSNLDYLNARYYDPARGQFLKQDPVFWELGLSRDGRKALDNPQAMNSYGYANSNPVLNKDPSGRFLVALAPVIIWSIGAFNTAMDVVDGYDAYITFSSPPGTFPADVRTASAQNLGKDLIIGGIASRATRMERAALDFLEGAQNILDQYAGSIYQKGGENREKRKTEAKADRTRSQNNNKVDTTTATPLNSTAGQTRTTPAPAQPSKVSPQKDFGRNAPGFAI